MRKLARYPILTAALTLTLTDGPASAATWTVTSGGGFTGTGRLLVSNVTKSATLACHKATISGTFKNGVQPSGNRLITINTITLQPPDFSVSCPPPIPNPITITIGGLPWYMSAQSYASGITSGIWTSDHVLGIHAFGHGTDGCDATIGGPGATKGQMNGTYTNTTGRLRHLGGNLVVKTTDADCDPIIISPTDQINMDGNYVISPKPTVTSP